jgi:hypothetical protein
MGEELREFLGTVHEALDPEQRRLFAELLADGTLLLGWSGRRHHRAC